MNEHDSAMADGLDPDTAPDRSRDGWPEKFAEARVHRGRPPKARPKVSTTIRLSPEDASAMSKWSHRFRPKYWPRWYRIAFGAGIAGALLGGALAWYGPGWGRYTALVGAILCFACLWLLLNLPEDGPNA